LVGRTGRSGDDSSASEAIAGVSALKAEYERLELNKMPMNATKKEALASIRADWWCILKIVRTHFAATGGESLAKNSACPSEALRRREPKS